ncbi:hypothetical protein ACA910_003076 [Epithemia clementina (nom. ined.)]
MSESKPLLSNDDAENLRRLKAYQPWAFFITFGGYFMSHFSRKCYSTVKHPLEEIAGYPTWVLSAMDTIFMATYAAGNIINGKLGDTFNPTYILAIGLLGSGVCLLAINLAIWFDFEHLNEFYADSYIYIIYFFFGFFQATGGPVGTAVMGNWFSDAESVKNRGLIFGFWTCHQYMGDITAGLCTALILQLGLPYWWALTIPALSNIAWAFLTAQLVADPVSVGIVTAELKLRMEKLEVKRKELAEKGETMAEDEGPKPISYAAALAIPMVAQYALAFGFFKLTNYVLFFWLPYFLGNHFDDKTANLIALLYSVGMMPGGVIVGYVSDIFGGRRAVVIGTFMLTLIFFLAYFAVKSEAGLPPSTLLVLLGCMGILVGGPNNIITSAVAADLASHPSIRGNNKSLGTVTGLINGTGSITASLGLLAIGPLEKNYGWGSVWTFLIVCTGAGTLLMSTKIYAELFPGRSSSNVVV